MENKCTNHSEHKDEMEMAKKNLPDEKKVPLLADFFKVIGDSTRLRILYVLFEAEVCVCDLAEALNMTQSAISHQLKVLRDNTLVKFEKKGKHAYYSLADEHVREILDVALDHINE